MSKHNNNTAPCLDARCKCGRYISIGEAKGTFVFGVYTCPDCKMRNFREAHPQFLLTSEEYYAQFERVLK